MRRLGRRKLKQRASVTGEDMGLQENLTVKRILKPVTYVLAALYFLVDAAFHGHRQADLGLACQACRAEAIARLDQIVAALPVAGAVSVPVIMLEPSNRWRLIWLLPVRW